MPGVAAERFARSGPSRERGPFPFGRLRPRGWAPARRAFDPVNCWQALPITPTLESSAIGAPARMLAVGELDESDDGVADRPGTVVSRLRGSSGRVCEVATGSSQVSAGPVVRVRSARAATVRVRDGRLSVKTLGCFARLGRGQWATLLADRAHAGANPPTRRSVRLRLRCGRGVNFALSSLNLSLPPHTMHPANGGGHLRQRLPLGEETACR